MSAMQSEGGSKSALQYCTDLQILLNMTLDYVLIPLRNELKKSHDYSDILDLEIQDGENKTFEYIAQQISEICNAEEDVADSILMKYPSSITCFRCLGIDEDTISGLLYLRDITFLKLLDMPENEVKAILKAYSVSQEDTDRILMGLSKIRSNIDLLESDQPFEDDTRNLIKEVIRLTEKSEPSPDCERSNGSVLLHCDPLSSPSLYVTGPQDFEDDSNCTSTHNVGDNHANQRSLRSCRYDSDQTIETEWFNEVTSPPPVPIRPGFETHPSSCFSVNPPNLQFSFNHSAFPTDLTTQTLNRNSRRAKTPVPFHRFYRALSPGPQRTNSSSVIKVNLFDGGLSVPSTPAPKVFGTPIHQKSPSRGALMSTSYTSTNDSPPPPPHSPCSFFQRNSTPRERGIKMPTTPPSKHKIKFAFPLHRSNSHESNLASRICQPTHSGVGNGLPVNGKDGHAAPKGNAKITNLHPTPESHSPTTNDSSNIFCFPTPTHSVGVAAPASPKCTGRSEYQPNFIQTGRLTVPVNSNGLTNLSLSLPTHTHRFESETKFTGFVRRPPCAVCNGRLTFRVAHCIYCNLKAHKICVPLASKMPCPGPPRPNDSNDSHRNSTGLTRAVTNTPGPNILAGSDCSNSTSSCNSCSTPGSPFQVDGSRYLQANGNAFNLSQLSSLDHTPTPSSSNDPSFDAAQAGHDSLGELLIPPTTLSSCESSRATVEDRLSRLESVESQDDHPAFTRTNSVDNDECGVTCTNSHCVYVGVDVLGCGNYVHIPPNWLCYVAPEIMRAINICNPKHELPFTPESDVFAFGTVWHELLTCEYPFRGLPTDTLVYLVGSGIKPALKLQCPRDFKELMRQCWSYRPQDRPEFTTLVKQLDRLPKLHRSPSYPTKPYSVTANVSSAPPTASTSVSGNLPVGGGGGGIAEGGNGDGGGGGRISGNRLLLPILLAL
ncbi:unnamed protein product [Hymenolepis diminuta]|uniref:Phorbol-ester/DAG-type domain-containing protein n=1 Tax=Hymenolepis diminuta TaxID=6216 RepID=A0A158QEE1_HYMDI|nr:unnamed protein product [Hymenolepis diminuta]